MNAFYNTFEIPPEERFQADAEGADPLTLDELGVRDLLLRLKQVQETVEKTKELKAAIDYRYDEATRLGEVHIEMIRRQIQTWLEQVNGGESVSFPDAGGANLRKTPPKVTVVDRDRFREWAEDQGFTKTDVDEAKAKASALQAATGLGEIVPGVEIVPAGVGLTVRGT